MARSGRTIPRRRAREKAVDAETTRPCGGADRGIPREPASPARARPGERCLRRSRRRADHRPVRTVMSPRRRSSPTPTATGRRSSPARCRRTARGRLRRRCMRAGLREPAWCRSRRRPTGAARSPIELIRHVPGDRRVPDPLRGRRRGRRPPLRRLAQARPVPRLAVRSDRHLLTAERLLLDAVLRGFHRPIDRTCPSPEVCVLKNIARVLLKTSAWRSNRGLAWRRARRTGCRVGRRTVVHCRT